ncbi:protein Wnt-9a-like [Mercenaria mercenaria]|uniref:protein Wnt-9a-like n=1 Tax=Mercenaria mercenaria TaxID=6596 RepID=UPI00234ED46E|nr:protein Wnt-9a-like [Mercenaria mercenaria]
MYIPRGSVYSFIYLYTCIFCHAVAYFGLSARKPILIASLGFHPNMIEDKRETMAAGKLCNLMLPRQRKQRKMCRRGKGVADTLLEAITLSTQECEYQFKTERWNCTLEDQYRLNILEKGFKETSFLYAISSASLVHTFARACSRGTIDRCTCDESKNLQNREAWLWGGCGDNIKFGLKFSRRFLRAGKRREKDIRARVDQHNIRLGRKVVNSAVKTRCKCHGISGSCTVRTCWRQLSTFLNIGNIIKDKYENSHKIITYTNHATGKSPLSDEITLENSVGNVVRPIELQNYISPNKAGRDKKSRKSKRDRNTSNEKTIDSFAPRSNLMVHLEDSPTFCDASPFTPGTRGRVCDRSNCDVMCCGRGYNRRLVMVKRACQCQVHWCCYVDCKQCTNEEEVFLCK